MENQQQLFEEKSKGIADIVCDKCGTHPLLLRNLVKKRESIYKVLINCKLNGV
jgi:hypothetical protein